VARPRALHSAGDSSGFAIGLWRGARQCWLPCRGRYSKSARRGSSQLGVRSWETVRLVKEAELGGKGRRIQWAILIAAKNETSARSRIRQNAGYVSFPRILANAATASRLCSPWVKSSDQMNSTGPQERIPRNGASFGPTLVPFKTLLPKRPFLRLVRFSEGANWRNLG